MNFIKAGQIYIFYKFGANAYFYPNPLGKLGPNLSIKWNTYPVSKF